MHIDRAKSGSVLYLHPAMGEIHFKTDNSGLFEWSLGEFAHCKLEIRNLTRDLHANGPVGIMTGYEEKFYQLGTPINRCELINVEVQDA